MSPRRSPRRVAGTRPVGGYLSDQRTEEWRGREWTVRAVSGANSVGKTYRCPGCDQEIRSATAHLVVWAADDPDAGDRRHWHSVCWAARDRRTPGVIRGRSAPRYGRGR